MQWVEGKKQNSCCVYAMKTGWKKENVIKYD
jgi:hypothetical protein